MTGDGMEAFLDAVEESRDTYEKCVFFLLLRSLAAPDCGIV